MPSLKNQQAVADLQDKISKSKSIIIADYSGIDSAGQVNLRAQVAAAGGEFGVAKNRLFKVAVTDSVTDGKDNLDQALNGPNAFLFSYEDAVAALKALFKFADGNENLEIKVGILDGKVLSFDEVQALSKLPSKPELIVKLIGQIQAPAYGLVNVLSATTRNLVQVLSAIKDKKESN